MSTFSGLNTAWTGLNAARRGVDVAGQNVANATTAGYTRQRVDLAAIASASSIGMLSASSATPGLGVQVTGIARLGDEWLDTRVRATAGSAGFWQVQAEALHAIESSFGEPGDRGIAGQLQSFWSAWEDLGNRAGEAAPAEALLATAHGLAAAIATGYASAADQWAQLRGRADSMVAEVNTASERLAALNAAVRQALADGRSPNELLDQRAQLTIRVAELTGATLRTAADGTIDVLVGGNPLVSADRAYPLELTGDHTMGGAAVAAGWVRTGTPAALESGELAGALAALAPAASGSGGSIAEAAAAYDALATTLMTQVNAVHQSGATPSGATGLDFFALTAGSPAALGLSVVPTDVAGIAAAAVGAGALDGSLADAIAQLRTGATSPDSQWATFVTGTAVHARQAAQSSSLADLEAGAALGAQRTVGAVDLDEETMHLMTHQTAYQAAARVMTTIDALLDTLINRTGVVGR